MKKFAFLIFAALLPLIASAQVTLSNGRPVQTVVLGTLLKCEDVPGTAESATGVCIIEHRYTPSADVVADTLVKTGAGFVHTMTCAGADAAATAGSVALRDGTTAGGGTVVKVVNFQAAWLQPFTLTIDASFTSGIYLDFTTTNDVACQVSFR